MSSGRRSWRQLAWPLVSLAVVASGLTGCGSRMSREAVIEALAPPDGGGQVEGIAAERPLEGEGAADAGGDAAPTAGAELSAPPEGGTVKAPATGTANEAGAASATASSLPPTKSPSGGSAGRKQPASGAGAPVSSGSGAGQGGASANPAPAGAATGPLSTVVIGNIGEYSGPVAASLGSGRPMAMVVARWLNDHGGLNGHPVKMLVADNGGDPSRYLSLTKQMVEKDGAIAFLGNQVPITAAGAEEYLRQKGIPILGGEGAHSLWFSSPVMFFPGTGWQDQWIGAAGVAAKKGSNKLAMFYCVEAEPCQTANSAFDQANKVKRAGVDVVYRAQVSIVQPDFTSECLQAQSRGATVVAMSMDANSMSRVARSCGAQGYTPLYLTLGPGVVQSLTRDPYLKSVLAASPVFPWMATDLPGAKEFHKAVQQYNPSMEEAGAAAQVWVAALALQKAGAALPATPGPADIMKGIGMIRNETFGGLAPAMSFPTDGPRPVADCFFVLALDGGKWTAPQGSQPACP